MKKNIIFFGLFSFIILHSARLGNESDDSTADMFPDYPLIRRNNSRRRRSQALKRFQESVYKKSHPKKNSDQFFNNLTVARRQFVATSRVTVGGKLQGTYIKIPTLVYALYAKDFVACNHLLHNGADKKLSYKKESVFEIAKKCKAPQNILDALQPKEPEQ